MKPDDLPDFANPYKTKGHDVRLVNGRYHMFRATSLREQGKKYHVLKLTYSGTINHDKGLILKKQDEGGAAPVMVEFGLSNFIFLLFSRELARSVFNGVTGKAWIRCAVIMYIYGHCNESFMVLSLVGKTLRKLRQSPVTLP